LDDNPGVAALFFPTVKEKLKARLCIRQRHARLARLQAVLSLFQALGGGWLPPGVAAGVNVVQ